jgi:deoxyribodipyrimidine photolyase-related protein
MHGKKQLRMEFFYRWMRQRTGMLMQGDEPEGGQWNYDSDNRQSIPKQGLGWIAPPQTFAPDAITQAVMDTVEARFVKHPGKLDRFTYPVTREQALAALDDFIQHRLADFGQLQDAMWTDEPFLFHSLISAPLNCQLLHPQEVLDAALTAYQQGKAPLNSVEGFVRQILGWREFMRGIYGQTANQLLQANHFNHQRLLPDWFWTGNTDMQCLSQVIGQTLATGYAHHIQRLMVIGLYATLAELHPQQVSDWFHAVYIDATDWVQRPNVIGMALYANGGHFTSKPYLASGAYIDKMSNYCQHCRFKPKEKTGANACPITQLYWRFLINHFDELSSNPRTSLMVTHVKKMSDDDKQRLLMQAERHLI